MARRTKLRLGVAACLLGREVRDVLPAPDRTELAETVEGYAKGLLPLVVPLTLFRHHVRRHAVEYLAGQTYLDPDPKELMLRNHV